MKSKRFRNIGIKLLAGLTAAGVLCSQPMVGIASGEAAEIKYIEDIAALTEEESHIVYKEKPPLDKLEGVFPETLTVLLEGDSDVTLLDVVWECETDYTAQWSNEGKETYVFSPRWDETAYALREATDKNIEIPTITVEIDAEDVLKQIDDLETAQAKLQEITAKKSILAVVYLCDTYDVKDAPAADAGTVATVASGQSVQIEGVDLDSAGNAWYKALFYQQDKQYEGYIEKRFLVTSDEDFTEWADENVKEPAAAPARIRMMPVKTLSSYPDINQFPASYQNALLALKNKYPNWTFVKMETGLDFDTAVANELGDKNWISSSKPGSWQNGPAAQTGWSYASRGILRYYMDPRNFLTETSVFQFEQLTYNASYHTESAVQGLLANSFMKGSIPDEDMTYAQAFTEIGAQLKVSPFHLASRVLQEQGKGTSPLISGTYGGMGGTLKGYYNYFNVGAYGKDTELINRGLTEAKNRGWDTRYKSLQGGASVIGQSYILRGQDTLYLQKFNVSSNNTYNHQYMQNVMAPESEAASIKKAYTDTNSLNHSFVFKIPVYSGMPASACSKPDSTDTITLNQTSIDNLAVDKTVKLVPYVNSSRVDSLAEMTFTSNDPKVATVDAQGIVRALLPGTATITCARSGATSASCTVKVVKAEPVVDTPVLSTVVYKPGLKLADISLPAGWSWSDADKLLQAGTASYPAVYTPDDTAKYLTVTRQIGIKVSQAVTGYSVPKDLKAKIGSKLGSIALPAGFVWESDAETVLDKAGEQTFYLSYFPEDKNYFDVLHIPVIVQVIDDKAGLEDPDEPDGPLPDISGSSGSGSGGSGSGSGSGSGGSGTGSGSGSGGSGTGSGNSSGGSSAGGDTGNGSGSGSAGGSSDDSSNGAGGADGDHSAQGTTPGNSNTTATPGNSTMPDGNGPGIEEEPAAPGAQTPKKDTADTTPDTTGTNPDNGNTGNGGSTQNTGDTGNTGSRTGSTAQTNTATQPDSGAQTSNTAQTNAATQSDPGAQTSSTAQTNAATQSDPGAQTSSTAQTNAATQTDPGTQTGGTAQTNAVTQPDSVTQTGGTAQPGRNAGSRSSGRPESGNAPDNTAGSDRMDDTDNGAGAKDRDEASPDSAQPVYDRPAVSINMEDDSVLTEEMLQMGKEQNIDFILTMNDRVKWYINATTKTDRFIDTDMGVTFSDGVVSREILSRIAGDNEYLEFDLAHDGQFGFGAELEIALDPKDCGRYANLFYYDSETGELEFICASLIDENGYARFSMEHASHYVIIVSDSPMNGAVSAEGKSAFPLRQVAIGFVVAAALAALGTGGYLYWRKKREETGEDEEDTEDTEDTEDAEDIEDAEEESQEAEGIETDLEAQSVEGESLEADAAEDDWIEDADWEEPESEDKADAYEDDHAENDWIEDDEWDISNDWMDDAEWEKKSGMNKTEADQSGLQDTDAEKTVV